MADTTTAPASAEPPAPPGSSGPGDTGRLDDASRGRLWAVLIATVALSELIPFQYTLVAVITSRIGADFPAAGDNVTWLMIIVAIVGGASTPVLGKVADMHGKKRVLLACAVAFTVGSLICAVTTSWPLFLTGRALQGTAMPMSAVFVALLRDLMPRRLVPLSVGLVVTGFGVSALTGPFITGYLTDHHSWRACFWFLAGYALITTVVFAVVVPESRLRTPARLDWTGSVLVGAGAALVLLYVSSGESWGWGRPSAWGYLVAGLVLLAAFVAWERRTAEPIVDMALLRKPTVLVVIVVGVLANMIISVQGYAIAYMALTGGDEVREGVIAGFAEAAGAPVEVMREAISFNDPLDYALGYTLTGLAVLSIWQCVPSLFSGPLAGAYARRRGQYLPYVLSLTALTAAMVLYGFFHSSWQAIAFIGLLFGLGSGAYYASAYNLVIECVPQEQQGVVGGMTALTDAIGAGIGPAVTTAIVVANPFTATIAGEGDQPATTTSIPQVYADAGWSLACWVLAGCGAVAVLIAAFMRGGRKPVTGGAELSDH